MYSINIKGKVTSKDKKLVKGILKNILILSTMIVLNLNH